MNIVEKAIIMGSMVGVGGVGFYYIVKNRALKPGDNKSNT